MDKKFARMVEVLHEMRSVVVKQPNHLANLQFLDRKQAAEYIGMSDFWLEKHCNDASAPKFFRHGRKCWYKRSDLDTWVVQRKREISDADNIWKRGEARRLPSPSEDTLAAAYKDAWGADEQLPNIDPQDAFAKLVESLTPAQRQLLASTLVEKDAPSPTPPKEGEAKEAKKKTNK
jgi:predicted DNA-binding transcriptional regulator AlpA